MTTTTSQLTPYGVPFSVLRPSRVGRLATASLFYELNDYDSKGVSVYSIGPEDIVLGDGSTRISARKIYMEQADPTEYRAAIALLGDWRHWQVLVNSAKFKPVIEEWREELRTAIQSEAMAVIMDDAKQNPISARWLVEQSAPKNIKRGRPSKAEIESNLRQMQEEKSTTAEDLARLGL